MEPENQLAALPHNIVLQTPFGPCITIWYITQAMVKHEPFKQTIATIAVKATKLHQAPLSDSFEANKICVCSAK